MVLLNARKETLVIFKHCLRIGGLWPPENYERRSLIIFLVSLLVQAAALAIRLIDPLEKCPPYNAGGLAIGTIEARLIAVMQQFAIRIYGSHMVPLIESTTRDWASITDPAKRDIMKRHDESGSFYFLVQTAMFCGFVNARRLMDSPFFRSVETLKDKRVVCVFADDSLWIYVMPVLNIALSIALNLILRSGDILFWSFGMHLSAQFKILKKQFEAFLSIESKKERRREFRRLVERHKQLLDLCTSLERAFRFFVAASILDQQITVCLYAFSLGDIIATGRFHLAIWQLFTLVLAMSCIYTYYHVSDYLTECCEEIGHVFTYCEWYTLSKESRRDFSIVVARCQRPVVFSVAKLYRLSLANFLYVVQSLYSFVSYIVAFTLRTK